METSSRRKACDLCFKKKIRCDGLKPTCSNCSLYKVPCKTTTIRRRPTTTYKPPPTATVEINSSPTPNEENGAKRNEELEARLARIEAKLDALNNSGGEPNDPNALIGLERLVERDLLDENVAEISPNGGHDDLPQTLTEGSWHISSRNRDGPPVPPLTEALPILEVFFQNYNSLIPLFNQQSFMRLVNDYYKPGGQTPRVYGAIINVVLALGYRVQFCQLGDATSGFNDAKIKACVENAQAMLDELMIRDEDTLGLQALLGLVILYQSHIDQTASSVLIGAAIRIAHAMRLESKAVLSELAPQEARQRANIFWVCYILDKDISLRTMTPSLQIDSDIDIDLPGSAGDDSAGHLYTVDGRSQLHLFRLKVQLAHLEGMIYDTLLSNRARKLTSEARQQAVTHIGQLLERWKQSIPGQLQLENMSGNLLSGPLVHMTVVYQTYLMCLTMTHGLYANDSPWLKALGGLGSDLLRTFNPQGNRCMEGNAPATQIVWERCVGTSRAILNILSYQTFGGCNVWLSACAYFSALTFLLVNLIYYPTSDRAEEDQKLAELSMLHLQKYFDFKGLEKFRQLRNVLVQIETVAKSALRDARKEQSSDNSDNGEITGSQSRYPFDPAFFPHTLPLGNIFDISFQDMTNGGEQISTGGMGQPVFNSMNANLAGASDIWQTAFEPNSLWGSGPA